MPRRPKFAKNPSPIQAALIRELLETDGLSVNSWAKEAGLPESSLRKVVTKDAAGVTVKTLERLARARNKTLKELLGRAIERGIPLVGRIGAGAEIYYYDAVEVGQEMYIEPPEGLEKPEENVALEIEGNSMYPFQPGWRICYSRQHDGVTDDEIGKLCVVKIREGGYLLKVLQPGREAGRFNLESWNAPTLHDQDVEWASRVTAIIPR